MIVRYIPLLSGDEPVESEGAGRDEFTGAATCEQQRPAPSLWKRCRGQPGCNPAYARTRSRPEPCSTGLTNGHTSSDDDDGPGLVALE